MASSASPSRRVLGNKSTNTFLQAQSQNMTPKLGASATPVKHARVTVMSSPPTRCAPEMSPRTGQKRRREEIGGTREDLDSQSQSQSQEMVSDSAPSTQTLSDFAPDRPDEGDEMEEVAETSTVQTKSTSMSTTSTMLTSFHASQEPPIPVEETFDIHEELMSQQTLEKIHAVKFSQGNCQFNMTPHLQPSLTTELSQDSVRLSSFIDLDECDGAKYENDGLTTIPSSSSAKPQTDSSKPDGKTDFAEKAQILRTRLQLALYKVQTNQTSRPFSRLQKPRSSSPDLPNLLPTLNPSFVPRNAGRSTPIAALRGGGLPISPESRIAVARARSSNVNQFKPKIKALDSLAVPELRPGCYSSRFVTELELGEENEQEYRDPKTPRRDSGQAQAQGAPNSGLRTTERQQRVIVDGFGGLTSSVVKGEAANGLLELRRAAGVVSGV